MEMCPETQLDERTLEQYKELIGEITKNPIFVRSKLMGLHHRLWDSRATLSGKYIAFEGIDGSGKTVQKDLAVSYLKSRGVSVYSSDEPKTGEEAASGPYTYSGWTRDVLDKKFSVEKDKIPSLFAVSRAQQHWLDLLVPRLSIGQHALYSRSVFSNLAYQGNNERIMRREVTMAWMYKTKLFPDIVILVDVDPQVAMDRIGSRGTPQTLYEKLGKLTDTRNGFLELAKIDWREQVPPDLVFDIDREINWIVVDGNKSVEDVHEQIRTRVLEGII